METYRGIAEKIGKAEAVVLYPKEQEKIAEPNAGSLVLFWKWEGVRAMFTGDLPDEKERELLQNLPACEILQVGHHGSATSTCREFLEQVQPSLAVISCAMRVFRQSSSSLLLPAGA